MKPVIRKTGLFAGIRCGSCNYELQELWSYCPMCGKRIEWNQLENELSKRQKDVEMEMR